jgi:hypothetical protein
MPGAPLECQVHLASAYLKQGAPAIPRAHPCGPQMDFDNARRILGIPGAPWAEAGPGSLGLCSRSVSGGAPRGAAKRHPRGGISLACALRCWAFRPSLFLVQMVVSLAKEYPAAFAAHRAAIATVNSGGGGGGSSGSQTQATAVASRVSGPASLDACALRSRRCAPKASGQGCRSSPATRFSNSLSSQSSYVRRALPPFVMLVGPRTQDQLLARHQGRKQHRASVGGGYSLVTAECGDGA